MKKEQEKQLSKELQTAAEGKGVDVTEMMDQALINPGLVASLAAALSSSEIDAEQLREYLKAQGARTSPDYEF